MAENPTAVSSSTGLSDSHKAAEQFQGLINRGLFGDAPTSGAPLPGAEAAEAQAPPEPPSAEAPPESSAASSSEYQSLEEYLEQQKIERDSFLDLPVKTKVDGLERAVPLKDLIKSYQLDSHVTQKSQALADAKREWEAEQASSKQALQQQLERAQTLGNLAHQQLLSEYKSIDWNKLRAEDPAAWAVKTTEFNQRAAAIQQHLQAVAQENERLAQERLQTLAAAIPVEQTKMLDAIPTWRDEKVMKADKADMLSAAKRLGFTDAELSGIYDHRYVVALHYASQFLKHQAKAAETLRQVRATPKAPNPGARTVTNPDTVARSNAKTAFLKDRNNRDAQLRYAESLIKAGA